MIDSIAQLALTAIENKFPESTKWTPVAMRKVDYGLTILISIFFESLNLNVIMEEIVTVDNISKSSKVIDSFEHPQKSTISQSFTIPTKVETIIPQVAINDVKLANPKLNTVIEALKIQIPQLPTPDSITVQEQGTTTTKYTVSYTTTEGKKSQVVTLHDTTTNKVTTVPASPATPTTPTFTITTTDSTGQPQTVSNNIPSISQTFPATSIVLSEIQKISPETSTSSIKQVILQTQPDSTNTMTVEYVNTKTSTTSSYTVNY